MKRIFSSLYLQVLVAIVFGVLLGQFAPALGTQLQPLGDGFIKLIKMLIAPIVFTTVVAGVGGLGNLKKVGRGGGMALILGVDRFMSEARAITNFIGNTVATLVIARWNHEFDLTKAGAILARPESAVSMPAPDPPRD
jgi:Na+/H+-dicarboxylate symporter